MARRIALTLAYDGTELQGWQVQPGAPTVQGLLIDCAARILGATPRVIGASRTDAGVHALRQVATVETDSPLPAATLRRALNATLPRAIRVTGAADVPADFDARRHARLKRYAYLIDRGVEADPFLRRFAWHAPEMRDAEAMRRAARALRGKHDFGAFCAAPGRDRPPVCTVGSLRVVARRSRLIVLVSADRFLHHMVRNIVGSLAEVGRGAQPAAWVGEVLATGDRGRAGPTAPPQGLVLLRVLYPRRP